MSICDVFLLYKEGGTHDTHWQSVSFSPDDVSMSFGQRQEWRSTTFFPQLTLRRTRSSAGRCFGCCGWRVIVLSFSFKVGPPNLMDKEGGLGSKSKPPVFGNLFFGLPFVFFNSILEPQPCALLMAQEMWIAVSSLAFLLRRFNRHVGFSCTGWSSFGFFDIFSFQGASQYRLKPFIFLNTHLIIYVHVSPRP